MKRKNYYLVFFILMSMVASSQNLVPNGGFESYTSLPNGYSQFYKATGWSNVNGNTSGPPFASPDYYHNSGNTGTLFGPISPNSGEAQMGIYTYHTSFVDSREYVSIQLNTPLIPGQYYQLSFYLTNGFDGFYKGTVDNFGAHLSVGQLSQSDREAILLIPTIEVPGVISNQNYWEKYTFTFTATNAATYITFGNFEKDSETTVIGNSSSYYFIDDVELIPTVPPIEIVGDSLVCLGDSVTLLAINDNTFSWSDSVDPTIIISTDSTITIVPTQTMTYYVHGTADSDTFTVVVNDLPTINLGNDTTLCEGETILLDATTPNATYLWQDNSTTPTFNVTQQGIYWVEITVNNCSAIDSIYINYSPLPAIDFGNDTILCEGETLILDATLPNATYLWQDNSTTPTYNVTQQGLYWAEVTMNNCSAIDSIYISYTPTPTIDIGNDTTLCEGETLILDATTPNATYLWQDNSTTPSYNVTQEGLYWAEVTVNNCSAIDSIYINFTPTPTVDIGNDTTICEGEILLLDATIPNATYLWQDNSTGPTFNVTQEGIYWVEVTVDNCSTIDNIYVGYTPIPTVDIGNDTTLCEGETLQLDATTSNATYLWQDNSTNPTFNVTQQGIYGVEVTVDNCSTLANIYVNYNPIPTVDIGNDTSLCQSETLLLDVTTPDATYLWQDNSTNSTFNVTEQGINWVEVTVNGCSTTDSIIIDNNLISNLGNDTTLCEGETILLDATTPNATYLWQDNSTNPTFDVTEQGIYWVEVSLNSCNETDSININYTPIPAVDLGNDTTICQGETLVLDATSINATYLWQDNSTNPTFDVTQAGTYWVEVTANNCSVINTSTKVIDLEECKCTISTPNVFSPNFDSWNDNFSPKADCILNDYRLVIFNRWGEKIFETNDFNDAWDGTYHGQPCPIGVYVYSIKYKYYSGYEQKTGSITLLK